MRVMLQVLPPGVEHGHQPDRRAEMLGVGGDAAQRLGRRLEQQAINDGLVLDGDRGDRRRHGEHDMKVRHRQQLSLPVGQPGCSRQPLALRAMPVATRVVGDADLPAVGALLDMTAQRRRAASLDGPHHPPLTPAQMAGMGLPVGSAMAAQHIRHLQAEHAPTQAGGITSRCRRSSGLGVPAMTLVATRV